MKTRVNKLTISVPSTASTTTVGSALVIKPDAVAHALKFYCPGIVGFTGGVLDLYIQHSFDDGTTWIDGAHLPQIAAGQAATSYDFAIVLDSTVRAVNSAAGTPALAVNTVTSGPWGDQLRVVAVTGGGTSGATQALVFYVYPWHPKY